MSLKRQQQKNALAKKTKREHLLKSNLPELSLKTLKVTKKHGQTTVKEQTQLTGGNRNTIKAHLKRLVSEKHLKKHGLLSFHKREKVLP